MKASTWKRRKSLAEVIYVVALDVMHCCTVIVLMFFASSAYIYIYTCVRRTILHNIWSYSVSPVVA